MHASCRGKIKETHELIFSWLSSGIAHGRVRTTTAAELPNMAAILQKRNIQPKFTVYFFDIGHPCYDELTPVKTSYPLTTTT